LFAFFAWLHVVVGVGSSGNGNGSGDQGSEQPSSGNSGTLDTSFGSNGKASTADVYLSEIDIDSQDRILGIQETRFSKENLENEPITRIKVYCYRSNGNIDEEFGTDGISTFCLGHVLNDV